MKQEYVHIDGVTRKYEGVSYTESEIQKIFSTEIKEKLLDTEGTNELSKNLIGEFNDLISTDFDTSYLVDILKLDDIIENHIPWRIGEAFAEYFIETTLPVKFYYNELRDTRNVFGNKTGADLLGFININGENIFLFGEVKTSSEEKSPPNVLQGRHGMIDQLKNLSENTKITRQLVRNFGFKVKDLDNTDPFRIDYLSALKNYTFEKFHLIGILVRDTEPNKNDLRARFNNLSEYITNEIGLNLTALYIPIKIGEWNNYITN